MAEYLIQDTSLDAIADAINAKTGGSSAMTPAEMVTAIGNIPSGGGGQQKVLLASGTFTQASNSTVIVIPTPNLPGATDAYIEVDETTIDTSANYCKAIYLCNDYQQIAKAALNNRDIQLTSGIYVQTGVLVFGYPNGGIDKAPLNRIYGYGQYVVKVGTYNWYVWGYAE